jgi:hypothetical protein
MHYNEKNSVMELPKANYSLGSRERTNTIVWPFGDSSHLVFVGR